MARPVKKQPEEWEKEILDAAKFLFLSKGYEETSVSDIMERAGGAKGMFYRFFESKEKAMQALGDRMFLENNPFEVVRARTDLNGLQKIREVLAMDRADGGAGDGQCAGGFHFEGSAHSGGGDGGEQTGADAVMVALIEEGRRDGSIQTEYARELSELLPLVNFWLMPSVFPANAEEIMHKCKFVAKVLADMGLPVADKEMFERTERLFGHFGE